MPAPAWEDLSEFLDTEEFASTAVFTLLDGSTAPAVVGIYDDPSLVARAGEYVTDADGPRFTCPEAAVADVERGCSVTITQPGRPPVTCDVLAAPDRDGTGMAVVILAPVA